MMRVNLRRLFPLLLLIVPRVAHAQSAAEMEGLLFCDRLYYGTQTSFSSTNFTLDQSTDKVHWIFQCTEATTITQICYLQATKTGTPPDHTLSIQGINSTGGVPDGTPVGGGSPASVTFATSGISNGTFSCQTLANSYACTRGQFLAGVLEPAAAPDGANNIAVGYTFSGLSSAVNAHHFPSAQTNDNGTVTRRDTVATSFAWKSASKTYGSPFSAFTSEVIDSSNTLALKFKLPTNLCSSFTLRGFFNIAFRAAGSGTFTYTLTDGDATYDVIQDSDAVDGEFFNTSSQTKPMVYFNESSLTNLNCGTNYRLAISSTAAMRIMSFSVPAAADMEALEGGQNWTLSSRTSGDWTDVTTKRPAGMCLLLGSITPPPSGGASASGGMEVNLR